MWSKTGILKDIIYADGYWAAAGEFYTDDSSSTIYGIAYSTSLDGEWTAKNLITGSYQMCTRIAYANGCWVVGGEHYDSTGCAVIAYATSLSGEWTTKDLWSGSNGSWFSMIRDIIYENNNFVVVGASWDNSIYYGCICYSGEGAELPTITTDGAFNYIRAKEE